MMSSRILATGDSLSDPGAAMSARRPFPLRTLMVCFTAWLIATEVLIFDQIKFDAKVELLEQAARALREPQLWPRLNGRPISQAVQRWRGYESKEFKTV